MFESLSTEKPYPLDITGFREKGKELSKAIEDAVKSTQSVIIRAYPNRIIMSQDQYKMLTGKGNLIGQEWEGQEFFLYRTKFNIMEVEVKL